MQKGDGKYIIFMVLGFIGFIVCCVIIFGSTGIAAPAFDHSDCQYPLRESNPVDGCDNTDPARPECLRTGLEDC